MTSEMMEYIADRARLGKADREIDKLQSQFNALSEMHDAAHKDWKAAIATVEHLESEIHTLEMEKSLLARGASDVAAEVEQLKQERKSWHIAIQRAIADLDNGGGVGHVIALLKTLK